MDKAVKAGDELPSEGPLFAAEIIIGNIAMYHLEYEEKLLSPDSSPDSSPQSPPHTSYKYTSPTLLKLQSSLFKKVLQVFSSSNEIPLSDFCLYQSKLLISTTSSTDQACHRDADTDKQWYSFIMYLTKTQSTFVSTVPLFFHPIGPNVDKLKASDFIHIYEKSYYKSVDANPGDILIFGSEVLHYGPAPAPGENVRQVIFGAFGPKHLKQQAQVYRDSLFSWTEINNVLFEKNPELYYCDLLKNIHHNPLTFMADINQRQKTKDDFIQFIQDNFHVEKPKLV
jgi:hypothetical protein